MNDSKTAHRFKNKESERRSTRRRTDDPLDADKVSHPRRGRRRRVPTGGLGDPALPCADGVRHIIATRDEARPHCAAVERGRSTLPQAELAGLAHEGSQGVGAMGSLP